MFVEANHVPGPAMCPRAIHVVCVQLSALMSVSCRTLFINDGDRNNYGQQAPSGTPDSRPPADLPPTLVPTLPPVARLIDSKLECKYSLTLPQIGRAPHPSDPLPLWLKHFPAGTFHPDGVYVALVGARSQCGLERVLATYLFCVCVRPSSRCPLM